MVELTSGENHGKIIDRRIDMNISERQDRELPSWDAEAAIRQIAGGGRYACANVMRRVYRHNCEIFRAWGYRTRGGKEVVFGDRDAFLDRTKVCDRPFEYVAKPCDGGTLWTECVNADCVDVASTLVDDGLNPAILNLASRFHACGGYDKGAGAQEESICRASTLSLSLYQYFDPKLRCVQEAGVRAKGNAYPLDIEFGGIYSGDVTFFRHNAKLGFELRDEPFTCGVITVPALNFRENSRYDNSDLKYRAADGGFTARGQEIQLNKIRTIFRLALANGHDSLVLGAFGCGVFQLPPEAVALQFNTVIDEKEFEDKFRTIVFAILEGPETDNHPTGRNGKFAPFYYIFGD